MRAGRVQGKRRALRHTEKQDQKGSFPDRQRCARCGGLRLYAESRKRGSDQGHEASRRRRICAGDRLQQRQCQYLQCGRRRDRGRDVRARGRTDRHSRRGCRGRVYRRHRAAAFPRTDKSGDAFARGRAERRRQPVCGAGNHDDGHRRQTDSLFLHAGRERVPHRCDRKRRGHDQPEHGDHADLYHDGRVDLSRNAAKGAFGGCERFLQHGQRRRRHLYQRHGLRARKRNGGE